jgi:hypothetical protein
LAGSLAFRGVGAKLGRAVLHRAIARAVLIAAAAAVAIPVALFL